jgi:hypothetical protein
VVVADVTKRRRVSGVSKDQKLVVRQTKGEQRLWQAWAAERDMTVSDFVRAAVEAYAAGEVGVTFSPSCMFRVKHHDGIICTACGGSRRRPT